MRRLAFLVVLESVTGCGPSPRSAAEFAADPVSARAVVRACDAGLRRPDCAAAREWLAEARRRERMTRYEQAF